MKQFTLEINVLAHKLMQLDPIYGYLDEAEIEMYISEAIEAAKKIGSNERYNDYRTDLKIIDRYSEGNYAVYSEIELTKSIITVYRDQVENLRKEFEEEGLDVSYERLRDCFILHEIFHYLEYNKYHFLSEQRKVCVLNIMGFKRMVPIKMLSEIGANVFIREVLGDPLEYIQKRGEDFDDI